MIVWRDVLNTTLYYLPKNSTILEVLLLFEKEKAQLVFVKNDEEEVIGYVDRNDLIQQIHNEKNIKSPLTFRHDILKVPEDSQISFYHNISVYLGMNKKNEIAGFVTSVEAKHQLSQYRLHQLNQIFNSSGTGIITTDSNYHITFINGTAEEILGLSKRVLLYRNYKALLTTEKNIAEVLAGNQLLSIECSINFKQISGNFLPLYENEKIIGIVHIFSPREQLEEAVKELEFVRDLNNDLQAIYSSANEQIMVTNHQGEIIRLAGTFLADFWNGYSAKQLVGQNIIQLEKDGYFQPNIIALCIKRKKKLSMIQESVTGRKIWSVATPVFHQEKLEKVVVLSRDITAMNKLKEELALTKKKTKKYKEELDELLKRNEGHTYQKLVYRSQEMEKLVEEIKHIAKVDSTVLLMGESGAGKEVFAQAIHEYSNRNRQSFVRVNCGAIPKNLLESELFGYEKGAFTGADQKGKPGLFELAHKGSIFLDEVTELPYDMQVKLLRVLQEKEIMRVGGTKVKSIDVRIIAATNQDLKKLVIEEKFREDLYYRLNVIPIKIPPLRERIVDILPLCLHFIEKINRMYRLNKSFSREAIEVLEEYDWPGNVRELQNVIERLAVTTRNDMITDQDVFSTLHHNSLTKNKERNIMIQNIVPLKKAVEEVENQLVMKALEKYGSAYKAAEALGVSPATISRRMQKIFK
ncbi:sigma-54-dependent Fis family transcriptional regulator [Halalkalibacterium ligniniphilum]|uniref:sigma-54-dependent Fis family transcriptional regulator n=1 Tax=Halalkalibacterium ligniniphilum TaxID=1134413 RepID=UPI00034A9D67|nr:sigma-54-dependent Fis family transcriptional regulator [Halalkalibacterium ligniniphilum]